MVCGKRTRYFDCDMSSTCRTSNETKWIHIAVIYYLSWSHKNQIVSTNSVIDSEPLMSTLYRNYFLKTRIHSFILLIQYRGCWISLCLHIGYLYASWVGKWKANWFKIQSIESPVTNNEFLYDVICLGQVHIDLHIESGIAWSTF